MTARALRDRMAAAAAVARPDSPLRLLIRRRAPLSRQGERLGELDLLLRLSLHGEGNSQGVLVFDWPTTASGHSVLRVLEPWAARAELGETSFDGLRIESRPAGDNGTSGTHLKVYFDADAVPDSVLPLLDIADRLGVTAEVEREITAAPKADNAKVGEAKEAGRAAASEPRPEPQAAPEPAAGTPAVPAQPHPEQERIDRIEHHADYDPQTHPRANPNDEFTNSRGETFRLVLRRARGAMRRQWVRVGRTAAHTA